MHNKKTLGKGVVAANHRQTQASSQQKEVAQ